MNRNAQAREHRRALVARLRLRGQSAREIQASLQRPVEDPETKQFRPLSINPGTGKPWGLGTIGRDFKVLEKRWREQAGVAVEDRKAKLSAETDEVKAEGWRQKDLRIVLAAQKQERDLWGLDEPARTQLTGAGEGGAILFQVEGLDLDKDI